MIDPIPAYIKDGETVYFPAIQSLSDWAEQHEEKKEEREKARIKNIQYWFDELADDDETRMGLIELVEACAGNVPYEAGICTACGSNSDGHNNNNSECQD